jgi:hypothetical protein
MFYGSYIGFGGHIGGADYKITNALIFDGSADELTFTPSQDGTGAGKKYTLSFWTKTVDPGDEGAFFAAGQSGGDSLHIQTNWNSGNEYLNVNDSSTSGSNWLRRTGVRRLRDTTAWMHFMLAVDFSSGGGLAGTANAARIYINGVEDTSFATVNTHPASTDTSRMTMQYEHVIGNGSGFSDYKDMYLAEFIIVDGQQLAVTDLGGFDARGVWLPKNPSALTFGNNGCHLDFKSANLGTDASGNGNNFTVVSMGVKNNIVVDTCTDDLLSETTIHHGWELATSDQAGSWGTPSQELGGTKGGSSSGASYNLGTLALTSGKWYWRIQITQESSGYPAIGVHKTTATPSYDGGYIAGDTNGWCILTEGTHNGKPRHNGSNATAIHTYSNGDYVDVALDMDNGKIWFGRNGTFDGNPAAGSGEAYSSISGSLVPSMSTSTSSYGIIDVSGGTPPSGFSQYTETITGGGNFCTWNIQKVRGLVV